MNHLNRLPMLVPLAGRMSILVLLASPVAAQTLTADVRRHAEKLDLQPTPVATSAAAAQGAARSGRDYRWEIEIHGGGILESRSSGASALPAAGPAFNAFSGDPSRRVSSWYFGDGTALFNAQTDLNRHWQTIIPLDSALGAGVGRRSGGSLGGRVAYELTPRISAEFSVDYGFAPLAIDVEALLQVEASRESFAAAWSGWFFRNASVASESAVDAQGGHQLLTVGAVVVKVTPERRVTPFVTAGLGVIANQGTAPEVVLRGRYSFAADSTSSVFKSTLMDSSFSETDHVSIRYALDDRDVVGVVGGGLTYAVSRRTGIRLDVRAHIGRDSAATILNASPSVATQSPYVAMATNWHPSIQHSNFPDEPGAPQSTLTGAPIRDFRTFDANGVAWVFTAAAGWYVRF